MEESAESPSDESPGKVDRGASPAEKKAPGKAAKDKHRPIDIKLLGKGTATSIPLYGFDEYAGYVLLLQKGGRITDALLKQVQEQYQGQVYIFAKDWGVFEAQTEKVIDAIIGDDTKSIGEKSLAFYSYSTDRLEDAFRRISAEGGKQASLVLPVAKHALDMARKDWKALFSILKLAHQSPRTYAHCLNVCFYGLSYVHHFLPDYSEKEIKAIAIGFLCHDIGQTMVSDEIMNKTTKLTLLERRVIEQTPVYGAEVLKEGGCDDPLTLDIVLYHHERMDGSGYPFGLRKSKIPVFARVCAVAEIFDTLTTPRPYRVNVLTPFKALRKMASEDSNQFDMKILRNFIQMLGGQIGSQEENAEEESTRPAKHVAVPEAAAASWAASLPRMYS